MKHKIIARVIIQMLGAPKKHISDTLAAYIEKIKDEHKGIRVLEEFKSRPKKEGKLYNVFTELEIEAESAGDLVWFCFDYMPASVEIIEPEDISYSSSDFTDFLNDLQLKLHTVDKQIKTLSAENQLLKKNGTTLMKNLIRIQLRAQASDLDTLSSAAGVPKEHMERFLDSMANEGKIKKDGNLYLLQ